MICHRLWCGLSLFLANIMSPWVSVSSFSQKPWWTASSETRAWTKDGSIWSKFTSLVSVGNSDSERMRWFHSISLGTWEVEAEGSEVRSLLFAMETWSHPGIRETLSQNKEGKVGRKKQASDARSWQSGRTERNCVAQRVTGDFVFNVPVFYGKIL